MIQKKCHNCAGTGKVPTDKQLKKHPYMTISGKCYYCLGTGERTTKYGRNKY